MLSCLNLTCSHFRQDLSLMNKDDLLKLAVRMSKEMQSEDFVSRVRTRLAEKNTPPTQAVMEELEEVQIEVFSSWGVDGADALRQLKLAVKTYPGPDTHMAISQLCSVEESLLSVVGREVATRFGQVIPEGPVHEHGHSHDGKPCHGHDHSHQPHGHSHNGQPCHGHGHGHGAPTQAQMLAMQSAMESLSPQQKADMQAIQMKMMSGQPPTADDQQKMRGIQQHLMAYMSTMQQFMQQATAKK